MTKRNKYQVYLRRKYLKKIYIRRKIRPVKPKAFYMSRTYRNRVSKKALKTSILLRRFVSIRRFSGRKYRRSRKRFRYRKWRFKLRVSTRRRQAPLLNRRRLKKRNKKRGYFRYKRRAITGFRQGRVQNYLNRLSNSRNIYLSKTSLPGSMPIQDAHVLYNKIIYLIGKSRAVPKVYLRRSLPRIRSVRVKPYLFLNQRARGRSIYRKPVKSLRLAIRRLGQTSKAGRKQRYPKRKPFWYARKRKLRKHKFLQKRRLRALKYTPNQKTTMKVKYTVSHALKFFSFSECFSRNHKTFYINITKRRQKISIPSKLITRSANTLKTGCYIRLPKIYSTVTKRPVRIVRRRFFYRRKKLKYYRSVLHKYLPNVIKSYSNSPNSKGVFLNLQQYLSKYARPHTLYGKSKHYLRELSSRMSLRSLKHRSFVFKSIGMFLVFQSIIVNRATSAMSKFRTKLIHRQYSFVFKAEDKRRILNNRKRQVLARIVMRSTRISPSNP